MALNKSKMIFKALRDKKYSTAEKLIRSNTDHHILNAYIFRMGVPLAQVLRDESINLFMAKLLVESGANPNRLVTAEGQEESPMEMLVNLCEKSRFISGNKIGPYKIFGLHKQAERNPLKYREQLLELLDIFLAHEGNPDIQSMKGEVSLFHVTLANTDPDMDVIMRLSAAGGDLNKRDVHETTALMELIKHARADLSLTILTEIESRQVDAKELCLNKDNDRNETALYLAGFAGSPGMAMELLKRGAIATPCRKKTESPYRTFLKIPPLLSALLRRSYPCKMFSMGDRRAKANWRVSLLNKVISYSISPLVDNLSADICFPLETDDILMKAIVQRNGDMEKYPPPFPTEVEMAQVPVLMFGQLTAGLEQLCVRVIMERVVAAKSGSDDSDPTLCYYTIEDLVVNKLHLPPTVIPKFAAEEIKLDLGHRLFKCRPHIHCKCGCENLSSDEDESETDDSEYGSAGHMFKCDLWCCNKDNDAAYETGSDSAHDDD